MIIFVVRKKQLMERKDLTHGSIMGNIMTFSLPYMLAYFLQILYGLADLFVIGQYCGVDSTTAVSIGSQVMHMITVIIIGVAMGTTVRTARAVGANNQRKAMQIIGNSITLFLILAIALSLILLAFRTNIVEVMDTPAEAVQGTLEYLTICFIGIPFIVAYNVIASIYRGMGDSQSPMYFVIVACIANIILDYVFIGYCDMGASGAALGTTLSQMASVAVSLVAIRKQKSQLNINRSDLKLQRQTIMPILKIGIPISLQDGFIQISFIAITVIANGRGLNDAAAVGIVEKFIGLLFIVPSAMLSTVSAISAQNIGAGKIQRAQVTLKYATYITTGFGIVAAVIFQFIPGQAIRLFTNNVEVINLGGEYLQSYVLDCVSAGVHFCFSGFFAACGYSIISFIHNFISIVCARIPLSYIASEMYPDTLYPMGLAPAIGSLLSVVICVAAYIWLAKHSKFAS